MNTFFHRPFERTVTLHKDSVGHIGFQFKNGKIIGLVKDSSAARNGLLTEHHLLEVNGQNVVGIKDKDITAIIEEGGSVITVTVIPSFIYDHMISK
jgi:syntenin-1